MTLPPLLAFAKGRRARPRKAVAPRAKDRNAEARIQAAIVEWVRTVAPQVVVFHVPNGGYRTKAEAARMKWVGVLSGVWDLALLLPAETFTDGKTGTWHVSRPAFIEVKAHKAKLSPEQQQFELDLARLYVPRAVCRSIDDVRAAFTVWGVPTREYRMPQRDPVLARERAEAGGA